MKLLDISKYNFRIFLITTLTVITLISNITMIAHATEEISILEENGTITTDSLNVRSGPGKEYDVIGKVYDSETVEITGSVNDWYRIDYNGSEGYVSSSYITLKEDEKEEAPTKSQPQSQSTEAEEDEEASDFQLSNYTIPIIGGSIGLLFIIILLTLKGIRKLDDDEDDDEEDDEYDEDDEDDDEYEKRRYVRQKSKHQPKHQPKQQPRPSQKAPQRAPQRPQRILPKSKELDLILSNNPDDYRIEIDPIYFEDDINVSRRKSEESTRDEDLKKAMKKMEELQREIDRLKNQR